MKSKKQIEKELKKRINIIITEDDIHNLYDMFYMAETKEFIDILKLNKMYNWYGRFFEKVERIVCPSLYNKQKKLKTFTKHNSSFIQDLTRVLKCLQKKHILSEGECDRIMTDYKNSIK